MTTYTQHKIRMTDEMWSTLSQKCKLEGTDCSNQIRKLVADYINGDLVNTCNSDDYVKELEEVCDNIYKRCGYIPTSFFQKEGMTQVLRDHMELYCTQKKYEVKVVPAPPVATSWSEVL